MNSLESFFSSNKRFWAVCAALALITVIGVLGTFKTSDLTAEESTAPTSIAQTEKVTQDFEIELVISDKNGNVVPLDDLGDVAREAGFTVVQGEEKPEKGVDFDQFTLKSKVLYHGSKYVPNKYSVWMTQKPVFKNGMMLEQDGPATFILREVVKGSKDSVQVVKLHAKLIKTDEMSDKMLLSVEKILRNAGATEVADAISLRLNPPTAESAAESAPAPAGNDSSWQQGNDGVDASWQDPGYQEPTYQEPAPYVPPADPYVPPQTGGGSLFCGCGAGPFAIDYRDSWGNPFSSAFEAHYWVCPLNQ